MSEEIPPGTALILAIRAERSPYHSWAGEVIDNSLDAQATYVSLEMSDNLLVAKDDGIGITKDRDIASVKISEHGEMVGTKLGRFGVGIKYKSIQHGKKFIIQSISKDGKLRREVNWENMLTTGKWLYGSPRRTEVPHGTATGTSVTIQDLITKKPSKSDLDRCKVEIARRYYPALNGGKAIFLNGELIHSLEIPVLQEKIERTFVFPDKRTAHVIAGLLDGSKNTGLRQVDICISYRVIKPESSFGCDGYGGIQQMFAQVVLGGPWKLSRFKDDFGEDPYIDDLENEVGLFLEPILKKCESARMFAKAKHLEDILNEMVPETQRAVRPLRKKRLDRKGKKRKDKKEKTIVDAEESETGPIQLRKQKGIMIEFAENLHGDYGFGRAQINGKSARIQLAEDNPHIKELMQQRDQRVAAIALYAIAMFIYEGDYRRENPSLTHEPIGLAAWRLAGQQNLPSN